MKNIPIAIAIIIVFVSQSAAQTMVVLDQGHSTYSINNTPSEQFYVRQFCSSPVVSAGWPFGSTVTATELFSASYCRADGMSDPCNFASRPECDALNSASFAQLPRRATPWQIDRNGDVYRNVGSSSLSHGNGVTHSSYEFSPAVNYSHFQIFGERTTVASSRVDLPRTPFSNNVPVLFALEKLAENEDLLSSLDVVSVNASFGTVPERNPNGSYKPSELCDGSFGQASVTSLRTKGILVFVGLPNVYLPSGVDTWPACLDGVVNVGRSEAQSSSSLGIGVGDNGIDFFASGTNRFGVGNSYAAPKVAAFYSVLSKKFPLSSVEDRLEAMKLGNRTKTYRGTTAPNIIKSDLDIAIESLRETVGGEDPTIEEILATGNLNVLLTDRGPLNGEAIEKLEITLDLSMLSPDLESGVSSILEGIAENQSLATSQNSEFRLDGRRDVVLVFTGRIDSLSQQRFEIKVNNRRINGSFTASRTARTHTVEIHRSFLNEGENTFEISTSLSSLKDDWAVDRVTLKFHPSTEMSVGSLDTGEYGYLQSPARYTGARFNFSIPDRSEDYVLSMTGWDIDLNDETAVYVNGTFIGHLNKGGSSAYAQRSSFFLPRSILYKGKNFIELVQREVQSGVWEGVEDEKWAVKDLLVDIAGPDLSIVSVGINSQYLEANVPFSAQAIVSNNGDTSSPNTTLRFYISDDQIISFNDTLIGTTPLASIAQGQATEVIKTGLVTPLVNKNHFLGVCVDAVPNEINTNNNCSVATPLKSKPKSLLPVLMLLKRKH